MNAAGDSTHFEYDEMGRLTAATDALGHVTRRQYDGEGRLTRETDPEGRWITYAYDAVGTRVPDGRAGPGDQLRIRRAAAADPRGGPAGWRNAAGVRRCREPHATGGREQSRDRVRLGSREPEANRDRPAGAGGARRVRPSGLGGAADFALGDVTRDTYDGARRLTTRVYPSDSLRYVHDARGSVTRVEDGDSRLQLSYDAAGQLQTVTTGNAANPADLQPVTTIQYEYDVAGWRSTLVDPEGGRTVYGYDPVGSLTSLRTPELENSHSAETGWAS